MEGAPEDGPIAVAFHSNRLTEDFFGGGKNIFHEIFCDLLLNGLNVYELSAHGHRQPVIWLTGSNGDQNEKHCEGSHDQVPYLE